jgi:glycogen(starch) synthase
MPPTERSRGGQPLRVLMTVDAVGGVWQYAMTLSAVLVTRGITVTMAVMGPRPRDAQLAAAGAIGVDVIASPFKLEWMVDPWADIDEAAAWLLALERDLQPDVVHLNGYCHAALDWRSPVIVVAHSCVASWWRAVHDVAAPGCVEYRARVGRGLASAAAVIAPTAAMLAALRREYGDVVADGRVVSNGRATIEASSPWTSSKASFVFAAGRVWDEAKNIAALAAVAPALDWPVYVAGETAHPDGVACCDVDTSSRGVTYLGQVGDLEMRRWLQRTPIYALPARYEPFGLSILEAAAEGCALVLGDIDSLRENWDGAALFVHPDDRVSLTSAIQRLIADPAERTSLGCRARNRARGFDIERTADDYLRAYSDAVAIERRGLPQTAAKERV